jgi:hypothetical protein
LYFRINGITLTLPPLRQHPEDIPLLISHFLKEACLANNKPVPKVSADVLNMLCAYSWPGNVRELKHTTEYMALLGSGHELGLADLPPSLHQPFKQVIEQAAETGVPYIPKVRPRKLKRSQIREAINNANGNLTEAARILKISRQSIYRLTGKNKQRHQSQHQSQQETSGLGIGKALSDNKILKVRILDALSNAPLSISEISNALGQRRRGGHLINTLALLRKEGLITLTIPDKPNSRLQKYRKN